MSNYKADRKYTNANHVLAEKNIYARNGIEIYKPETEFEKEFAENSDIYKAIDYVGLIEKTGLPFAIQERTRSADKAAFNDITIRFERPQNAHDDRKKSEYYKLDAYLKKYPDIAFLMMYAVRGENKTFEDGSVEGTFQKYAFVDLRKLYEYIREGKIVIKEMAGVYSSRMEGGVMYAPVRPNADPSSTFVPFDVRQLVENFPDVVLEQYGFDTPKIPLEPGYKPEYFYTRLQGSVTEKQRKYIRDLATKNNLNFDKNALANMSRRDARELIGYLLDNKEMALERFPKIVSKEKPHQPSLGLDI